MTPALTAFTFATAFRTTLAAGFLDGAERWALVVVLVTVLRARLDAFLTVLRAWLDAFLAALRAVPDARATAFRALPVAFFTRREAAFASDLALVAAPEAFFFSGLADFFRAAADFVLGRPVLPAAFRPVARAAFFLAIANPFAQP